MNIEQAKTVFNNFSISQIEQSMNIEQCPHSRRVYADTLLAHSQKKSLVLYIQNWFKLRKIP